MVPDFFKLSTVVDYQQPASCRCDPHTHPFDLVSILQTDMGKLAISMLSFGHNTGRCMIRTSGQQHAQNQGFSKA
jgi:hypothetical protein